MSWARPFHHSGRSGKIVSNSPGQTRNVDEVVSAVEGPAMPTGVFKFPSLFFPFLFNFQFYVERKRENLRNLKSRRCFAFNSLPFQVVSEDRNTFETNFFKI